MTGRRFDRNTLFRRDGLRLARARQVTEHPEHLVDLRLPRDHAPSVLQCQSDVARMRLRDRTHLAAPQHLHGVRPGDVRRQNSWFSPPKIADTESSEKTFMIVSASSWPIGTIVMLAGMSTGLIGTVSVTTIPSIGASWNLCSALSQKTPCVAYTQTPSTPCARNASTFAISVPPVMITSSPTIAVLPRTRPVISVTST